MNRFWTEEQSAKHEHWYKNNSNGNVITEYIDLKLCLGTQRK